jgi:hypothetical protein
MSLNAASAPLWFANHRGGGVLKQTPQMSLSAPKGRALGRGVINTVLNVAFSIRQIKVSSNLFNNANLCSVWLLNKFRGFDKFLVETRQIRRFLAESAQ